MPSDEFTKQLEDISGDANFVLRSYQLVERWESAHVGVEACEPVLRFMEDHPNIDFGTPGPLVHFIERFNQKAFEEKLLESLRRKPTDHTVWMLNRLINWTKDAAERSRYLAELRLIAENPVANSDARRAAADFLDYQRKIDSTESS